MTPSAAASADEDSRPRVTLQDLARRLAHELGAAAALCEDCQGVLGLVIDRGLTDEAAVRLQGLDQLSQTLAELARLFTRLALADLLGEAPDGLLDNMQLADVRARLGGEASREARGCGESEIW